jgi:hypothetical protein
MGTQRPPITNIILGTMTLSYEGYGSRVHDTETADAMLTMYTDAGYGRDMAPECFRDVWQRRRTGVALALSDERHHGSLAAD